MTGKGLENEYAGFGIRFAARIVDSIIVFGAQILLIIGLAMIANLSGFQDAEPGILKTIVITTISLLMLLVWFLGAHLYYIVLHKKRGQTIGKKLLGVKVIRTNGEMLRWRDAVLRQIGELISTFALLLGYIWIAIDEKKQGWHDKIASTYVVKVKKRNE